MDVPFWESKNLAEMSRDEWESLCDGCGHCCLVKLEDEETDELFVTNVSCHLLDIDTCRCRDYEHRLEKVEMCLSLEPDKMELMKWLPTHCAYRLLSEGKKLQYWHPLISGNPQSVHKAAVSVKTFAQSEEFIHVDDLGDHVMDKL